MGTSCRFMSCANRKLCSRRLDPWTDWDVCDKFLLYMNQDYVYQREQPFSNLGVNVDFINNETNVFDSEIKKNKNLLIYQMYFVDRKTVKYISKHLSIPQITIYKLIERTRKRILSTLTGVKSDQHRKRRFKIKTL
jgi:hypothetical protein